jgi:type IV pilus assembly protein PilV
MLEVLISIVVIAFGLLGIAGLQAFAVKNNQSANMRTTASALALDMVDRVQSNWAGASAGAYNKPTLDSSYTSPVAGCKTTAGCTSSDLAATDLSEWSTLVASALPNGRGLVCIDNTPNDGTIAAPACDNAGSTGYVVKIWWRDDRTASGSSAATPSAPQRFSWQFVTWPVGP